MYFTRAQADEIVKLFDQAYLMELLGKKDSEVTDGPASPNTAVPRDPYREYGE
jgi:hypothetical protein